MRWCGRGEMREERDKHGRERKKLIKSDSMLLQCGIKNESAL